MSLDYEVNEVRNLNLDGYDGILYISTGLTKDVEHPTPIKNALEKAKRIDDAFDSEISVLDVNLPAGKLIYSPTGPMNSDYHDIRSFGEAAVKAVKRAIKAGIKLPLLVLTKNQRFDQCELVTLLGAMEGLYLNLQYREDCPGKNPKVKKLGVWSDEPSKLQKLIEVAKWLEIGRTVARDIGGADPERMAAPRVEEYVRRVFQGSRVSLQCISDQGSLDKEYPLFSAVNRAASVIERHRGRIMYLTYEDGQPEDTLFLVGKGVTYDTGGADVKAGGIMAGMSRDKCGAAAVAGFMKVVSLLQPKNIKIIGAMSMARNSIGENCYVSDEVITARSGKRIRIGNTDAEGRMIMADVLCRMKEMAQGCNKPHLITIATLTGHAVRTVGPGYTIVLDNGPARMNKFAQRFQQAGQKIGDMVEISTIRREDFEINKGQLEGEDILQALNKPSAQMSRGHQVGASFLIMASGLDSHGLDSNKAFYYSHLDIAGSAGLFPENTTGAPILALSSYFLKIDT